jgi:hypothetical protein
MHHIRRNDVNLRVTENRVFEVRPPNVFDTDPVPEETDLPNFNQIDPVLDSHRLHVLPNAAWSFGGWTRWSLPPTMEVTIGEGSGQRRSPFLCSRTIFDQIVADYEFSERILHRVKEKQSYFEHVFSGGEWPNILEIAASTYEHDAFFCLIRCNLVTKETRCLLFLKTYDRLKTTTLRLRSVVDYISAHYTLPSQPLLIFNIILSLLQSRAHDFLRWRQQLYEIEARIGVSANLEILRQSHYSDVEYDFSKLNADLTGIARSIADNELSVATMLDHARAFLRVVDMCERVQHPPASKRAKSSNPSLSPPKEGDPEDSPDRPTFNYLHEEVQSTISRAEMYLRHTKMTNDVLTSLTAALYNRINKSDTRSMKTIAVVTLFFLPSLFVAAIFSTGIFNFQAGEDPSHERVISRYGWVYLLVTLLLTVLTLVIWSIWFFWGEMWLDRLRNSRNSLRRMERTTGADQDRDGVSQVQTMRDAVRPTDASYATLQDAMSRWVKPEPRRRTQDTTLESQT